MDTTVCPWCHSEIVWDPEIGPEEFCPHCGNELNAYRTLSIELDEEEEEARDTIESDQEEVRVSEQIRESTSFSNRATTLLDEAELFQQPSLSSLKTVEKYGDDDFDMVGYEESVEKLLDRQEEIPQCPHCQEYMLFAGTQEQGAAGFKPGASEASGLNFLQIPYKLNVYVCPGCFHVHQSLDEEARLHMIEKLSGAQDSE